MGKADPLTTQQRMYYATEPDRLRVLSRHIRECIGLTEDPFAVAKLIHCANELDDRRLDIEKERERAARYDAARTAASDKPE